MRNHEVEGRWGDAKGRVASAATWTLRAARNARAARDKARKRAAGRRGRRGGGAIGQSARQASDEDNEEDSNEERTGDSKGACGAGRDVRRASGVCADESKRRQRPAKAGKEAGQEGHCGRERTRIGACMGKIEYTSEISRSCGACADRRSWEDQSSNGPGRRQSRRARRAGQDEDEGGTRGIMRRVRGLVGTLRRRPMLSGSRCRR